MKVIFYFLIFLIMTVFYRLRQDNQERSRYRGCYFARAVNLGTIETDELARIIECNCSLKRSDVLAVLTELSDVVSKLLADSHRVRLAGIGSLMVGINICFKPEKELRLTTDVAPLPP